MPTCGHIPIDLSSVDTMYKLECGFQAPVLLFWHPDDADVFRENCLQKCSDVQKRYLLFAINSHCFAHWPETSIRPLKTPTTPPISFKNSAHEAIRISILPSRWNAITWDGLGISSGTLHVDVAWGNLGSRGTFLSAGAQLRLETQGR